MGVLETIKQGVFYLDGGTGSYLQARGLRPGELPESWNLDRPEEIIALHRAYFEAGSHAVCANTFGANGLKFDGKDGRPGLAQVVTAAVNCAKQAREEAVGGQKERFIALDVGPLGQLLAPMGVLSFERAVELFSETVRAGARAGADFILIETMNDSYETKAAVVAAKESCSLPVFVSNVYDEGGRLMSGTSPEAMVAMLEGLGADVIGLNCSLGPAQMLELISRFSACASVPVLAKPNAGLPREEGGKTLYDVSPEQFADLMGQIVDRGAGVVGGCCGTAPGYIRALVKITEGKKAPPVTEKRLCRISSYAGIVDFGEKPVLIGERINPTGKKRFQQALRERDIGYILKEGLAQQEQGVQVLDVNVGLPEIDEPALLETCVRELQGVCGLPLQLDTADPSALERALRIYNGKPMINSVNGSAGSMDAVFPLVKKYGGLAVCLTLDETGIPETAEGRLEIAERIVKRAADFGIGVHELIFDPLAMTISSEKEAANTTLRAIALIRERLGARTILGVSNISFGLPNREFINAAFFTMALAQGLSAGIINPFSLELQKGYHAFLALTGQDEGCLGYIEFAQKLPAASAAGAAVPPPRQTQAQEGLAGAIVRGLAGAAAQLAEAALESRDPLALINEEIIPALDIVGRGFEDKTLFLPQLLMSAEAAKAAFEQVRKKVPAAAGSGERVILATVKGDIHDIGKNIVKAIMENYGFSVLDLGRDVPPETIVAAALEQDVCLVGLSALMTTTVPAMEETIRRLHEKRPETRVMVGGAVLTQAYADKIGADFYGKTAMDSVRYAERLLKHERNTVEYGNV